MADAAKGANEVKIEDLGSSRKRLTITVPAEVISDKINESLGTLATRTALPGFRKGRAPMALLERRFGDALRSETRGQVIAEAYASAIEDNEVRPVGEPEPVGDLDELEFEPGKPLTFSVEIEVVPEFDLPDLEGIEVKKPLIELRDEQIDSEIERECAQAGDIDEVKGDFAEGDRLRGPGTATKEGEDEPFFTHDNIDIIVPGRDDGGRGHVLGLIIEGLGGMLKGKKVGDTLTIKTEGPEGHELEHIRGKKLTIEMTIRDALRLTPATVEKVLELYAMESEDVLREQIRYAIEQRHEEDQRAAMRDQIYQHLDEAVDFDLPENLSARQATRLLERQRLNMLSRGGMTPDEIEAQLAELRSETEAQARTRLKLSFMLQRLAEHFEVTVSEQEINGRIAAMAAQRGERPDKLRTELTQSGAIQEIAGLIREQKAADRVIDRASVSDIPLDEWNELVKSRREGRASGTSKKTTTKKKTTKKKTAKS